jgi:hypothetical protein
MEPTEMNIEIDWQEPVQLTRHKRMLFNKHNIPASIEDRAGVYFFSRVHGKTIEPFYIGQSMTLRTRLKGHLGSAKITEVLREVEEVKTVRKGARWFSFGYLTPSKGRRDVDAVLDLVERYLIRHALSDGHTLINERGTKFKTHDISFVGSPYEQNVFGKHVEIPAD